MKHARDCSGLLLSGEISAASAVRSFAETVLSILNVDVDPAGP